MSFEPGSVSSGYFACRGAKTGSVTFLTQWLVLSASVYLTSILIPGFSVKGLWGTIKVAALIGILNALLGKALYVAIGVSTLGLGFTMLFSFLARWLTNAILLKIADVLSSSLTINGFRSALLAALAMSVSGTLIERFIH